MSLNSWMNSIADAGKELWSRGLQKNGGEKDKSMEELCAELCSNKGEAMGTALACAVVNAYRAMDKDGQLEFFKMLVRDYSPDPQEIIRCADVYKNETTQDNLYLMKLAMASPRRHLFRRINMSPTGTPTLVGMRNDLYRFLAEHDELAVVESDLQYLLESWFNRGFLRIKSIDWKTPAHILEKLIAYEAVHEMDGWDDLRRRLEDDRRCFAFFHPALEDEPLIFVEVALVNGLATAVQPLLAPKTQGLPVEDPDTAIFYSISNCQEGLRGISFGNFLIKQVVMELQEELPGLKNFSTLSPIPGFRRWLTRELQQEQSEHFSHTEKGLLEQIDNDKWHNEPVLSEALEPLLLRLCAHYLCVEKRRGGPLDPVARFHLGNGARIEQLNWLGDISSNGFKQSAGLLVNYYYELKAVEENHEAFVNENKVACSSHVANLLES